MHGFVEVREGVVIEGGGREREKGRDLQWAAERVCVCM
jgi:hypothetical protein